MDLKKRVKELKKEREETRHKIAMEQFKKDEEFKLLSTKLKEETKCQKC